MGLRLGPKQALLAQSVQSGLQQGQRSVENAIANALKKRQLALAEAREQRAIDQDVRSQLGPQNTPQLQEAMRARGLPVFPTTDQRDAQVTQALGQTAPDAPVNLDALNQIDQNVRERISPTEFAALTSLKPPASALTDSDVTGLEEAAQLTANFLNTQNIPATKEGIIAASKSTAGRSLTTPLVRGAFEALAEKRRLGGEERTEIRKDRRTYITQSQSILDKAGAALRQETRDDLKFASDISGALEQFRAGDAGAISRAQLFLASALNRGRPTDKDFAVAGAQRAIVPRLKQLVEALANNKALPETGIPLTRALEIIGKAKINQVMRARSAVIGSTRRRLLGLARSTGQPESIVPSSIEIASQLVSVPPPDVSGAATRARTTLGNVPKQEDRSFLPEGGLRGLIRGVTRGNSRNDRIEKRKQNLDEEIQKLEKELGVGQ